MKKLNITSKIVNSLNEASLVNTIADFDEKNGIISYYDKNILVNIMLGDKIIIQRQGPEYNLTLNFEKNIKTNSVYEIYNPTLKIDVEVITNIINKQDNSFYIEYTLKIGGNDMGAFNIDFKWEE